MDWPGASIIRLEHEDQNNHDLSTGWVREAMIKAPHRGGKKALAVLGFNGRKLLAAGLIQRHLERGYLPREMKLEVRKKNIGLGRRLRAGKDQPFLVFFEILDRDIKASLRNKDISQ